MPPVLPLLSGLEDWDSARRAGSDVWDQGSFGYLVDLAVDTFPED